MSQYNKTVLTRAGLALAKRANAGQAKFGITRAVSSAEDWSYKTTQDLEEVTAIPNIMQQGTIMDAEEVESNNSVIGVSLKFTNKDLINGYQIRIIGLYVKEEGAKDEILYAITTAVSPEYMPSFADKVLYRFNMQMYLVIGKAQAVNVVIDEGTAVTHSQFDKYKGELNEDLKKIENTHKEDMSHVVKSASINGGAEILPNEAGKLELVVPDPDLSKYVNLEQLKEMLKGKADITAVPDKTDTEEGIKQAKAAAKAADDKAQSALDSKADKTDVYTKKAVDDAFNTRDSNITDAVNLANRAQETANTKANASDVYTKSQTDGKLGQKITFVKCDSPQAAHDASTKPAADGSIVFGIYDMNDEPSEAYVAGQKINIEWLYNHLTDLQSTVESQANEIASLKIQLNDAVNQISYIKANYIEGRRFAKSQETQATAWENENPQRIAFITND
ncbi:MAG: phage tail protein [Lactobacillus crispatus]